MSIRNIATTYYAQGDSKNPIHVFYSVHVENAISKCVYHMRRNEFGAAVATVHDTNTGELFATYTYRVGESMRIVFENDPLKPKCLTNPGSK